MNHAKASGLIARILIHYLPADREAKPDDELKPSGAVRINDKGRRGGTGSVVVGSGLADGVAALPRAVSISGNALAECGRSKSRPSRLL